LEEIGDDYMYQLPAIRQLCIALVNFEGALDASDTGVGKTAVTCAVARVLGRDLFVVCPKSVIPPWERMARQFKVQLNVINYEMLRTGRTEWGYWAEQTTSGAGKTTTNPFRKFIWQNLDPDGRLLVFDECHKLKDYKTLNCHVGVAAIDAQFQVLALSATAADNPLHMKFIALLTGLIRHPAHFYGWMTEHGVRKGKFGLEFRGSRTVQHEILSAIHHRIFPARGARIRIADLGDRFPHTRIVAEAYAVDNADKIQAVYHAMQEEIAELRRRTAHYKARERATKIPMAVLKARQEIELLKVVLFQQMAVDGVAEGNRVVVMMNYDASIMALSTRLHCACLITGAVTGEQRQQNIDAFNDDEEPYILLNIKAGGIGIGLHGRAGGCPRLALISPTPSGIDLKQAVGRLPRAGGVHSIQRIVFAADTFEERMMERAAQRLRRVSIFNDDELGVLDAALSLAPEERAFPL
jgi:superfamily II DNA or RNA helicase